MNFLLHLTCFLVKMDKLSATCYCQRQYETQVLETHKEYKKYNKRQPLLLQIWNGRTASQNHQSCDVNILIYNILIYPLSKLLALPFISNTIHYIYHITLMTDVQNAFFSFCSNHTDVIFCVALILQRSFSHLY